MTAFTRADIQRWAQNAGPNSPLHDLLKSTATRKRTPAKDLPPSQGRTLTIVVPMPETLLNSGRGKSRHYYAKARERKAYSEILNQRRDAGLIPPPPAGGFGRVRITSVMYLGGRMDADNAMARHKWPIDWLQKNGYLVNDRYAEWTGLPTQIISRGQDYRIELTLVEP